MPIEFNFQDLHEGGSLRITATFKDTKGNEVTPKSLNYTLKNQRGDIINSKENESISPAKQVSVVLTGDDLVTGTNYFIIQGVYDEEDHPDANLVDYASYFVKQLP